MPSVPGPRDLVALLDRSAETLEGLVAALPRLLPLVDRVEALVDEVERLVRRIEETRQSAAVLIGRFEDPADRLLLLLDRLEPSLLTLAPTLDRLAETSDPREVDALVGIVDQLPRLLGHLEADVMPVLARLGTVSPDLHELLEVSRELNDMLAKLPGMGRIRRKVDVED
jgi:ABC-type transporter Mla subunit MlaD